MTRAVIAALAGLVASCALLAVAGCGSDTAAGTSAQRRASGWPPADWGVLACPDASPNFPYTLRVRNLLPVPVQLAAGGTDCSQWSGMRNPSSQLNEGAAVMSGAEGTYPLTPREYVVRRWTMGFALDWSEIGRAQVTLPKAVSTNAITLSDPAAYTELINAASGYYTCSLVDLGRTSLPSTPQPDLKLRDDDKLTVFARLGRVVVAGNCSEASAPTGSQLTITLRNDLPESTRDAGYPRMTLRASGDSLCWDYQQLGWGDAVKRPTQPGGERTSTTAPVLSGLLAPPWCKKALEGFPHYGGMLPFVQESPGADWAPLRRDGHASELIWYQQTMGVEIGDGFYVFVPPDGIVMTSAAGRSACMSGDGYTPVYPWLGPTNATLAITIAPTCPRPGSGVPAARTAP